VNLETAVVPEGVTVEADVFANCPKLTAEEPTTPPESSAPTEPLEQEEPSASLEAEEELVPTSLPIGGGEVTVHTKAGEPISYDLDMGTVAANRTLRITVSTDIPDDLGVTLISFSPRVFVGLGGAMGSYSSGGGNLPLLEGGGTGYIDYNFSDDQPDSYFHFITSVAGQVTVSADYID
jgi:hypothetical protein